MDTGSSTGSFLLPRASSRLLPELTPVRLSGSEPAAGLPAPHFAMASSGSKDGSAAVAANSSDSKGQASSQSATTACAEGAAADGGAARPPSVPGRLQALFSRGCRSRASHGRGNGGGASFVAGSESKAGGGGSSGGGAGPNDFERRVSLLALRRAHTLAHALSLPHGGTSAGSVANRSSMAGLQEGPASEAIPSSFTASIPRPLLSFSAAGGSGAALRCSSGPVASAAGEGVSASVDALGVGAPAAALRRAVTAVRTVRRAGLSAASKGAIVHAVADGALASFIVIQVGRAGAGLGQGGCAGPGWEGLGSLQVGGYSGLHRMRKCGGVYIALCSKTASGANCF
jgi:hypothetical protein